jgi:hypothetical protein
LRCRLLSQHRHDDALKAFTKLSKKNKPATEIEFEIDALAREPANESKGTWAEIFNSVNKVR